MLTKIPETYAAFTTPAVPLMSPCNVSSSALHHERMLGHLVATLGVTVFATVPVSFVLGHLLHRVFPSRETGLSGDVGLLVTMGIGMVIGYAHHALLRLIPLSSLYPYFGHKIEETVAAFRKVT